ncbi:hypothetical protein ACFLZB_04935 [Nanoarchaeota archaeon]
MKMMDYMKKTIDYVADKAGDVVFYAAVATATLGPVGYIGCGGNTEKKTDEQKLETIQKNIENEVEYSLRDVNNLNGSLDREIAKTDAESKKLEEENKKITDELNKEAEEREKENKRILEGYGIK